MKKKYLISVVIMTFICIGMMLPSYATAPYSLQTTLKEAEAALEKTYIECSEMKLITGASIEYIRKIDAQEQKIESCQKLVTITKTVLETNPKSSYAYVLYYKLGNKTLDLLVTQQEIIQDYKMIRLNNLKNSCETDLNALNTALLLYKNMAEEDDYFRKNVFQSGVKTVENYISLRKNEEKKLETQFFKIKSFTTRLENIDVEKSNISTFEKEYKTLHNYCIFYLSNKKNVQTNYDITKREVNICVFAKQKAEEIKEELNISSEKDEFIIVEKINQYICDYAEYDMDYIYKTFQECVTDRKMVCWCYSQFFKLLCEEYGLEVGIVGGYDENSADDIKGHEWNVVKVDGKLYYIDVTWNDYEKDYKKYFMLDKDTFSQSHDMYAITGISWTKYFQ